MRPKLTIIFILLVAGLSAVNKSTKATQFAVIDMPTPIVSLSEDSQNIYLLENPTYTNSGIQVINKQTGESKHLAIPDSERVTDLKISDEGVIYYVVTNKGLYRYDEETKSSKAVWEQCRSGRSYKISFSPNNQFILLTGHHNVLLRQSDYCQMTQFDNVTTRKNIVDNDGVVWNMCVNSVNIYAPGSSKAISYTSDKYNQKIKPIFEHAQTLDIMLAHDNNIYLLVGNNIYSTPQANHTEWKLVSTYFSDSQEKPHRLLTDQSGNFYLTLDATKDGFIKLGTTMPKSITPDKTIKTTHIKEPISYTDRTFAVETKDLCGVMDNENLFFLSNDNKRLTIYSPQSTYTPFMGKYTQL